jgi:hypothetical protein
LLKSMLSPCMNPCATSLVFYLTTVLVSFCFRMKTHLNLIGSTLEGVGITALNTSLLFGEPRSTSITSFHLIQSKCCLHSAMVLGLGSLRRSASVVKKYELTIVVLWSNKSP